MSRLDIDQAAVAQLLYGTTGPVVREVTRVARETQALARTLAPVDKGPLRNSIQMTVDAQPSRKRVTARVGSRLPYAIYQERGTGIYAGRDRIRPRTARALRFKPKDASDFVFAKSVRGTPAIHYLTRALRAVSPWPVIEHP